VDKDNDPITVFMCGDVMLGRGIDQVLPNPCDPVMPFHCLPFSLNTI
jgi:poly-gamma-glutamate synthesis protein (capsule biosynthesis protein)